MKINLQAFFFYFFFSVLIFFFFLFFIYIRAILEYYVHYTMVLIALYLPFFFCIKIVYNCMLLVAYCYQY